MLDTTGGVKMNSAETFSDGLLHTDTPTLAPAKSYIHQLYADIRWSQDDQSGAMDNRDRWVVDWLVELYGISTVVGYLTPNPFLCK